MVVSVCLPIIDFSVSKTIVRFSVGNVGFFQRD